MSANNDMDTESGLDKIQGTILAFIWRHWGKPWTPSPTRTANLKVRTHKLHNTKHQLQCSMYTYKLWNVYPLIQKKKKKINHSHKQYGWIILHKSVKAQLKDQNLNPNLQHCQMFLILTKTHYCYWQEQYGLNWSQWICLLCRNSSSNVHTCRCPEWVFYSE